MYDEFGTKLVSYTYDAWGNHTTSYFNNGANTPASYNRIRYRGYYYDHDLYLYYLGSRYYDANTCRFINADDSLYHSMLGYNMFAYCKNNPIKYIDPTGQSAISLEELLLYYMTTGAAIAIAEPTPIGEVIYAAGGIVLLGTVCLVSLTSSEASADSEDVPQNVTESDDVIEIGETDKLPPQGNVTAVPDAPPVEAGKQGKHVPGHNNYDPNKSSWNKGENGVKQTQEAWKNSKPHPRKPNTRVGFSKDGRKIEIKYSKKGIHGFPIFP